VIIKCPVCNWESNSEETLFGLLVCSCCHITSVMPEARTIPLLVRPPGQDVQKAGEIPLGIEFTDKYRLLRVLGTGEGGSQFLARGQMTGRTLSVEFLRAPEQSGELDRFVQEAKSLSLVRHPCVLEVVEGGEMGGYPYLVSEHNEGGSLAQVISKQVRPERDWAVRCIVDVLDGVAACHEGGVVHGGLCPERIVVSPSVRARIAKPGLANEIELITGGAPCAVDPVKHRDYCSPDQREGLEATPASDIYSAGAILRELLTGVRPAIPDDRETPESRSGHDECRPLDARVAPLPGELGALVDRAMSSNPDDRPTTAAEFAEALRRIAGLPPITDTPRPPVNTTPPLEIPKPLPTGARASRSSTSRPLLTSRWIALTVVVAAILSTKWMTSVWTPSVYMPKYVPDAAPVRQPFVVDMVEIRTLFENRQFSKLTAILEGYQAKVEKDPCWESCVCDAFNVFDVSTPSYRELLDSWVKAEPQNRTALTARAVYEEHLGWKSRGTKWARDTTEAQFAGMRAHFESAVSDASAALRINPRTLVAHTILMHTNACSGDKATGRVLVEKALRAFPDSFAIRMIHMNCITPRWGGSYEAMVRFALESAPHASRNPLLKTLPGTIRSDQASMAKINNEPARALELHDKALAYGENVFALEGLAEAYRDNKIYDKALSTVDRALALRPNWRACHALRSEILFEMERLEESLAALKEGERIGGPFCKEVIDTKEWVGEALVAEGHELFRKPDLVRAIDKYTWALRFFPDNPQALCWRGIAYDRTGRREAALADLCKAINLDPKLYDAYGGLGNLYLKQGRFDESIEVWTKFLRLDPGNADAYLERAGTCYRKRDLARALADAKKSCELGNSNGCKLAEHLDPRPARRRATAPAPAKQ